MTFDALLIQWHCSLRLGSCSAFSEVTGCSLAQSRDYWCTAWWWASATSWNGAGA